MTMNTSARLYFTKLYSVWKKIISNVEKYILKKVNEKKVGSEAELFN